MCFWAGTLIWGGKGAPRYDPTMQTSSSHRWFWISTLMCLGLAARLFMFVQGIGTYMQGDNYLETLRYLTAVNILATCGYYGLTLLVIEHHHKRSTRTRSMLWGCAGVLALLGALGGMKEDLAYVALTIIISERLVYQRVNWKLFCSCAVLGLLFLPISEQYRQDMRSSESAEAKRSTSSLVESAQTASKAPAGSYLEDAADSAINRLDLLFPVHFLVDFPDLESIRNPAFDALTVVMYPFVPRLIWPDKPISDLGQRMSRVMGFPESTSSAASPFGALFIQGRLYAVSLGMLCLGIVVQLVSNFLGSSYDSKTIFVYVCLFLLVAKPEWDLESLYAVVVQNLPFIFIIGTAVYGGKLYHVSALLPNRGMAAETSAQLSLP